METTQHIIALQNGFVLLPCGNRPNGLAATIQYELMETGYMLDADAYEAVSNAPREDAIRFHDEVVGYLHYMLGDTGNYVPLYTGFPQQVMQLDDEELFLNQILHYWSDGAFVPDSWTGNRPTAFEHQTYTILRKGSKQEFEAIFTTLCASKQALSPQRRETVKWFAAHYQCASKLLPATIPFKETLCMLAATGLPVKLATATDVLRLAVYLSGGDVSLPPVPPAKVQRYIAYNQLESIDNPQREKFRFINFDRKTRRMLLDRLEQSSCDPSEMALHAERWKRLGEVLHPQEYKHRYPQAATAFQAVRNDAKSWYAQVMAVNDTRERIALLAQRPGEFMRRIDHLLRSAENADVKEYALQTFAQTLPLVSSKVLYELYNHFIRRTAENGVRPLMLKGKRKPLFLPPLPALDKETVAQVLNGIERELKSRYAQLPALGKTYIDMQLQSIPVPMQMRDLNPSLMTLVRGTRIPLQNKQAKVLRFYLHWKDAEGTEDLDLSATFIGNDAIEYIAWDQNKRTSYAVHSGDVRHRQGDCAEYIDIMIDKAREKFRYVVISAHNFDRRPMNSLDAAMGYMEREHAEANPIWIPSTVTDSFRFASEAQGVHMIALDLEQMQYIILDMDSTSFPVASLDTESVLNLIRLYTESPSLNMYQLLQWHAEARGTLTENKDDANTIFDYKTFVTQYTPILQYIV